MSALQSLLERRRLILASALLLALAGVASWNTMPREEDPQFPERSGVILVPFPGADAETVERLVLEPLEEHLAEVEELAEVLSTARAGIAVLDLDLADGIYATDAAWDEVEDALTAARRDFPEGVGEPVLNDDVIAQEAVVLAITGSADPLALAHGAKQLKRALLALDPVRKVLLVADPGEQITIEYDDATARRLGVDPRQLGQQLAERSRILPGGVLHLGAKTAALRPHTEFEDLEEISATPIVLPSGAAVPLGELARVRRGPQEPAAQRMRWRGEPAVGLGIIPKNGLDRIAFGRQVRATVDGLRATLEPLRVEEVAFQPDQVEDRLDDLSRSLLLGVVIVAVVLFLSMGPRMGLLVVLVVPLVAFGALAIFAAGGGILHQISIAALVIALGMLVDNAIVMSESIQYRIDRGMEPHWAAVESVRELAFPLATATGTTLAAFVPMLVSRGSTADFTRAIPTLIMLTLSLSYLFAILVTPVLAQLLLRRRAPNPTLEEAPEEAPAGLFERWTDRVARIAVGRSAMVLVGAAILLALTLGAAGWIDQQFFPAGDRAVVLVDLTLPEGTHLEETDRASRKLEDALAAHPEVEAVASFLGRGAPRFYYNLIAARRSPHVAQLVARTRSLDTVEPVMEWSRNWAEAHLPEAQVVPRRLEQGPPVDAPVELRILGDRLEDLEVVADAVLAQLKAIPETRDVRHSLGLGVPTVTFEIDDAAAGRRGLSRQDVGLALLGRTLGAEIGQYRQGEDPVPILVRSAAGERFPAADLATVDVATPGGTPVPLEQIARIAVQWRPAAILHFNGRRQVRVFSQLAQGATSNQVLTQLQPRLDALELPPGVEIRLAGEAAESGDANSAILAAMPLGAILLLFFLLAEFNSFRRVAIILVTVPLAAIGVVPGLLLSGQPFGFMSVLGVISLVGIVVNNAIVLLDVIEQRRADGLPLDRALRQGVRRRTRPILLTMATTVAGLSPLAFSETSLWPPLAWSMISGLIASTLLTLLVVPALYKVLFSKRRPRLRTEAAPALLVLAALGLAALASPAAAQEVGAPRMTILEAVSRAVERPAARAGTLRAEADAARATALQRRAFRPTAGLSLEALARDPVIEIETPFGTIELGDRLGATLGVEVVAPLWDPVARRRARAAGATADAAASSALRQRQLLAVLAMDRFIRVLNLDSERQATEAFLESLEARRRETQERVEAGRALEADALKLTLEVEAARLDLVRLAQARRTVAYELGTAVGADGPVEPLPLSVDLLRPVAELPELLEQAEATNPELAAAASQATAAELRSGILAAESLPRLEARAAWSLAQGDALLPESLAQATLGISWRFFDAGTREPRSLALEAEQLAAQADLQETARAVALEVVRARSDLETAREAAQVRERGVELARETLRVETERHRAGRATTNDLLAAEATLRRQRTDRDLARLDVLRAWIALELAIGDGEPVAAVARYLRGS